MKWLLLLVVPVVFFFAIMGVDELLDRLPPIDRRWAFPLFLTVSMTGLILAVLACMAYISWVINL